MIHAGYDIATIHVAGVSLSSFPEHIKKISMPHAKIKQSKHLAYMIFNIILDWQ